VSSLQLALDTGGPTTAGGGGAGVGVGGIGALTERVTPTVDVGGIPPVTDTIGFDGPDGAEVGFEIGFATC